MPLLPEAAARSSLRQLDGSTGMQSVLLLGILVLNLLVLLRQLLLRLVAYEVLS